MKNKILIIKLGYTEILDKVEDSRVVSLGDVLRTTPLLYAYKEDYVTWVTSEEAFPLLADNPLISRLLHFDLINSLQLLSEEFDVVINLEKVPGICAWADKIRARKIRYGFTFNSQTGNSEALDKAYEVLAVSFNPKYKKENKRTFQELLFEMVEKKFNGEECILGYKPTTPEIYDLGFNIFVGKKWPSKAWPIENWDRLQEILKQDFSITRQDKQEKEILTNLYTYMDWINSSKFLITNDSLGLHIALALKKNVLALFGPTSPRELYLYNRGKVIFPDESLDCMPCFEPKCSKYENSCIKLISPEKVAKEIKDYISNLTK